MDTITEPTAEQRSAHAAWIASRRRIETYQCARCGAEFTAYRRGDPSQRYCSVRCRQAAAYHRQHQP